jgi:GNAT superfamily N-acetyltransferase
MAHVLDNVFWHSLSGPQAGFAMGEGGARRYAKGFSPIIAFADNTQPDFAALLPYCDLGEQFYCGDWCGVMPSGWNLDAESSMYRMVWQGDMPVADDEFPTSALGHQHAQAALALAKLTNPGPFGLRTIELGQYLGYFDGDRLLAMAGERSFTGAYREVSGVCTHPDVQGKGLASRLMRRIIRRQLLAGETPFLHVMCANDSAHQLYLRMGFADYCKTAVRVVSRTQLAIS